MVWINVSAVAVEAIRTATLASLLCIDTSPISRSFAITLAVVSVVTTARTSDGVPLVELTVVTTVTSFSIRTFIETGAITLVAVAITTSILTVLREQPLVVVANKDIVANTLQSTVGTGHNTLALLTVVVVVTTTVLSATPGILGSNIPTVATVVVRAASITFVGPRNTVVAVARGCLTPVGAVTSLGVPVPVLVGAMLDAAFRHVDHTAGLTFLTLVAVSVHTTQRTGTSGLALPLVVTQAGVVSTNSWNVAVAISGSRRTLVAVAIRATLRTELLLGPGTVHTFVRLVAHTLELTVGAVDTLAVLTERRGRIGGVTAVV